jgi:hypothetical protein
MADPIITPQLLAAAGAGVGALMKPNNPLQGALLGGIAGYTGGSLYGASQVAAPGVASAVTPAQGALLGTQPAVSASQQSLGSLLGTQPTVTSAAAAPVSGSTQALLGTQPMVNAASTSGVGIGTGGFEGMKKFAYENPGLTMTGLNSTKELLTPEQMPQMSAAPAMPVQAGRGLKPYDPTEALNPYRQSVIGGQPISLLG